MKTQKARRMTMEKKTELRAALYARCSTNDKGQDPELQLLPLREYCQRREFTISGEYIDNGVSGTKDRRPQLDRLMDAARKRQFDIIIVWKLDRFGRSLKQLVVALDELSSLGIGFVSLQDSLDFSTAQGRLMFHIIGAMAEFERELIRERVKAGLENARRKGNRLGRRPLPKVTHDHIHKLRLQGLSLRKIASKLGVSVGTVHGVIAA
jgi:DNA invertase Pin-like site-specific DNA recombinase